MNLFKPHRKNLYGAAWLAALLTLSACGQRGPLVLPPEKKTATKPNAQADGFRPPSPSQNTTE